MKDQELKEQSDYSKQLLHTIPSAVFTLDNDRKVTSWNKMAARITGYEASEVIGQNAEKFSFHPCRENCRLFCGEIVAPEDNLHCKIRHKNGDVRYILKNVDVLRDDRGEIIGRIECFNDVTDKMLVEERLKESEMRLNLTTSSTNIGLWDWQLKTGKTVFNEQWAAIIGYTLAELEPINTNTWIKIGHPDDIAVSGARMNDHFAGLTDAYECEMRLKHKSGQWVWVLVRGKVIEWDENGKPLRMVGTHIDITERKNTEEELRGKERLIAAVAMSIKELIETPDYLKAVARCFELIGEATKVDRVYLFASYEDEQGNAAVSQVVRWEAGENGPQAVNPEIQNIPLRGRESIIAPLLRGEAYYGTVRELKDATVREIFAEHNVQAIILLPINVRGRLWGAVGFDECKYERRWTEAEYSTLSAFANSLEKTIERSMIADELEAAKLGAEAANELKSQFVASISHEIRTPIQAILGYSALLKDKIENEQSANYLSAIEKAGNTLMSLISDILDLSKIEAGKIELQPGEVSVRRLFDDISEIFAWRIEEKNLALNIEVDDDLPRTVLLDEVRARQILFNLVGNAVKFTKAGTITVSARAVNRDLRAGTLDLVLAVADTGIGIPEDQQQAVFEPFKQKDGQSNKMYGGTGLGLAISKRLTEVMGGSIEVKSKSGLGATFTVTFPLVIAGKADGAAHSARTKDALRRPERQETAAEAGQADRPVPGEMLERLEQLKEGLWLDCVRTNRVNDIKKLAKAIREIGDSYRHEETIGYAETLQAYARAFDLKNIKMLLERFPRLIDRLER
ncbi:MAG: PAS domain S-box protein [Sporomusaceae bacterium]|nr:PAS domain S-box protein [Sporomusaceae bacterium]